MVALSLVSRGSAAIFPAVLAAFFGASQTTDAFFLAYNMLWMVGMGIGVSLEVTSVPHAALNLRSGPAAAARFVTNATRNALLISGVAIVAGVGVLAVGMAVSGVHDNTAAVYSMYFLLAPTGVACCVAGVYAGCLAADWKLESVIISNSFRGIGALVGAVVGGEILAIWPVAVGLLVGESMRVVWLRVRWRRLLAKRTTADELPAPPHGHFRRDAIFQSSTSVLLWLPTLVDRMLAGGIAMAAISDVDYAYRTAMLAAVLFEGGIAPWLLAQWSNLRAKGELTATWTNVYRPIAFAACAAVALGLGVFVCAPLIVKILLEHGKFAGADALVVIGLLRWYGVGLIVNMIGLCFERLLLARSSNRTYFLACVPRVVVRIGTLLLLVNSWGLLALPASYIAAETFYACFLAFLSWRRGAA
jgi:putative peptidoglycan lipid II flippase